ncbi:beta-ketoacyl-[acyl-carrier-protein] synthase family protein [Streptomyces sp. NPDC005900]|uniref:beta-ketoacyl-[acyl-carrier-protein] synthase family protein n=1 Tax=Streptomyces sp. NPDC005900 TaxID=3154569 RepID=UPI0033CDBAC5
MTDSHIMITGVGVVTPIGADVASFWEGCLAGTSGLTHDVDMDLSPLPCGWTMGRIPAHVKWALRERWGGRHQTWNDTLLHAVVEQALMDAQVPQSAAKPIGFLWGQAGTDPDCAFPEEYEGHIADLLALHELSGGDPAALVRLDAERARPAVGTERTVLPRELSERYGVPVVAARIEAACSGGLRAIVEGARLLRLNKVGLAVVSLAMTRNTPFVVSQYAQIMALSRWQGEARQASMPFDRRRSGMVLGEAAAALVLETAEHAAARGADPYAAIGGWSLGSDSSHITAPSTDALERVIRGALECANVSREGIDVVNAHGTSTPLNDITEARALHRVLGEQMARIDVHAVKSLTGHGSAASGLVESVAAALTLRHNVVPPTVTCTEPDPECGVRTSLVPVVKPVRAVLKNSLGFGGHFSSMVFTQPG